MSMDYSLPAAWNAIWHILASQGSPFATEYEQEMPKVSKLHSKGHRKWPEGIDMQVQGIKIENKTNKTTSK